MFIRLLVTLFGAALLSVGTLAPAVASGPTLAAEPASTSRPADPDALDRAGETVRDDLAAPGAAWVLRQGTRTVEGGEGEDGDGRPISVESPFLWGSVSKAIAGLVAARLSCDDTLDLDAQVVDLLPAYEPEDERAHDITVAQLLDHTSGIGTNLELLDDTAPGRRSQDAVAEIADAPLAGAPGEDHLYSSANYVLLSAVLEEVTGESYRDLVASEAEQRGVRGDTLVLERETAESSLVGGHRYLLTRPVRMSQGYDDLGLSYGYLGGSAQDLAALGRSVLEDLDTGECAATLATTGTTETGNGDEYGLGWRISEWNGERVLWHAGASQGYTAYFALIPATDTVAVVLQDAYNPLMDSTLLAAGSDATRVLNGQEPAGAPAPWLYWGALAAAVVAVLAALAGLRRPRGRTTAVLRIVLGAALAAAAWMAPGLLGAGTWRVAWLWAPDVTTLIAILGLLGVAMLLRGLVWLLRTGQARRSARPSAA